MIQFTHKGIYCTLGQFYIDPWKPVKKALITHGHSDHATYGHAAYIGTKDSEPIIKHRLGNNINYQAVFYGEALNINGIKVSFHPAGHVIGSAQIRLEYRGEVWVISGDYKTEYDGIATAFEPIACHHFITECTFGLPTFRWKNQEEIYTEINQWWANNAAHGKTSVLSAYSLGKAQRIIKNLNLDVGPLYTHGAIEKTHEALRLAGHNLPLGNKVSQDNNSEDYRGALILCPPSAVGSTWTKRFKEKEEAILSGWMSIRGIRRRRNADKGFVLSDHADWNGLIDTIKHTKAENIYTTHGYKDILAQYVRENMHLNAQPVYTEFNSEDIDIE